MLTQKAASIRARNACIRKARIALTTMPIPMRAMRRGFMGPVGFTVELGVRFSGRRSEP